MESHCNNMKCAVLTMASNKRRPTPFHCIWTSLLFLLLVAASYPTFSYGSESPAPASVELSEATFEELTAGKSVFIKFFAPWCGHSQDLAPAWERLGKEFRTSNNNGKEEYPSLIAEVDCAKYEVWCVKGLGITSFPTLLYGDPSHSGIFLEEYKSIAKSFDDLMTFSENNLRKPICSPGNIEACDPETQEKLYQYWNMSQTELQSIISAQEEEIRRAQARFRDEKNSLQQNYDEAARIFELISARIKRQLRLLKNLIQQEGVSIS